MCAGYTGCGLKEMNCTGLSNSFGMVGLNGSENSNWRNSRKHGDDWSARKKCMEAALARRITNIPRECWLKTLWISPGRFWVSCFAECSRLLKDWATKL